jgi:hypothetical protein
MTRRIAVRWRLVALIVATAVASGCLAHNPEPTAGPGSPTGSPPSADDEPTRAIDVPDGVWKTAIVLPPDPVAFQAAAASSGLVVGDRTVWARTAAGSWIPADAIDSSSRWGVVAWRGGFVDWGQEGAVRTSTDGLAWQDAGQGPGAANLSMITPAGDRLLLVGEGIKSPFGAWLSADGSTWAGVHDTPRPLWAAAGWDGHGMIVTGSFGQRAEVWFSADGKSWRAVAAPTAPTAPDEGVFVSGLATSAVRVVAIGIAGEDPAAWRSTDLASWTEARTAWGHDVYLASVVDLGGALVIAGRRANRPTLWLSRDGLDWTAVTLPTENGVDGDAAKVVAIGGAIVVFGYVVQDEGNGGSSRIADLVWTLDLPP